MRTMLSTPHFPSPFLSRAGARVPTPQGRIVQESAECSFKTKMPVCPRFPSYTQATK